MAVAPVAGPAPGERDLEATLGRAWALWGRLRADLSAEFGPLTETWSLSPTTQRWSLRLKQQRGKKRTVAYLIPLPKHFVAAFALGEKACRAVRDADLPAPVQEVIERAPRYPEGRGIRLEVRSRKDVDSINKLVGIKMAT